MGHWGSRPFKIKKKRGLAPWTHHWSANWSGSCLGLILVTLLCPQSSHAISLPSLPLDSVLGQLNSFLDKDVANASIKALGIIFDHRAYEPATPLGTKFGLDVGVSVEVVEFSPELGLALTNAGIASVTLPPFLGNARMINIHKGISKRMDIGFSYLKLNEYILWGADLKLVVFQPEMGPTFAVRLSRSTSSLPIGSQDFVITTASLSIETVTWTPQILMSKNLGFADPYMGIGYQMASGELKISTTNGIVLPGIDSVKGSGGSLFAFLGLSLKVPNLGARLTMEGAYSAAGYNHAGVKIGFGL